MSRVEAVSVTSLKGVGPALAKRLERLGIHTVIDLLFHLPSRYQDRTHFLPMGRCRFGDEGLFRGQIELADISYGRRRSLLVRIGDGTGYLTMRLFYFSRQQQSQLQRGAWLSCYGEVRPGPGGKEIVHPEYRLHQQKPEQPQFDRLTAIYPTTEGLGVARLRQIVNLALDRCLGDIVDPLQQYLSTDPLPGLSEALDFVHRPPPKVNLQSLRDGEHRAIKRLAIEEMLAHHLSLRLLRQRSDVFRAPVVQSSGALGEQFIQGLPFTLTPAQQRVADEVIGDLEQRSPMQRLVQGDVGSGKTVVAALAMLKVIESGHQVAFMAPTELLAEQHYRLLSTWFGELQVAVGWLASRIKTGPRKVVLQGLSDGTLQCVVGTHALFQQGVQFNNLGLIIVDEQHRFGVDQRLALRDKGRDRGQSPHQLVMTATPIPRTLALSFYADLDVSSIDELPPGRQPVDTVVISSTRRSEVVARVHQACRSGRQAYWVCPVIDESDLEQLQAATEVEETLALALSDLKVGLVHGRMKPGEKDVVMQRFRDAELDLLVATTVIEVGVDVPNASLMIIENAERLGLAQLHQLRGRVGRGRAKSSCVLLYHSPLSPHAEIRLATLRETNDGFKIAERDLEIRGPGELLGTRQTGLPQMRIADLARDRGLVTTVERLAGEVINHQPAVIPLLIQRWISDAAVYRDI